jgi:hypothetical protein
MAMGRDPVRAASAKRGRGRNASSRLGSVVQPRRAFESLEARTLLSGYSGLERSLALIAPPPAVPGLVLPLAVVGAGAKTEAGPAVHVNQPGPIIVVPQVRVIVLAPVAGAASVAADSAASDAGGAMPGTVNFGNVASLRAAGAPPEVFESGAGPQLQAPASSLQLAPSQAAMALSLASGVSAGYAVNVPADPHVEVEGSFNGAAAVVSVVIPVGPSTQSVHVILHPQPDTPNGLSPVLGKISLLDPSGETLAELDPGPSTSNVLPDDITVAMQNAPAGGQLVVRLTGLQNGQSVAGSQPLATNQANVPFLLEVQSQNQASDSQSAANTPATEAVGTLATTPTPSWGQTPPPATFTSGDGSSSGGSVSDQAPTVPQIGTPINDESTGDGGGYCIRMAAGPLVSRSAGPLGPVLAASGVDLTPPVDRHERALLQEIPNLDRENDSENTLDSGSTGRSALAEVDKDSAPSDSQPGERYVTVVPGAGGFPMKVTSRPWGDRAGLAGLLAALPQPVQQPSAADSPPGPGSVASVPTAPIDLAAQSPLSSPEGRRRYPGYLKAACGLVVFLGLTSGPLFSDLVTSFRRKTSRWRPLRGAKPQNA